MFSTLIHNRLASHCLLGFCFVNDAWHVSISSHVAGTSGSFFRDEADVIPNRKYRRPKMTANFATLRSAVFSSKRMPSWVFKTLSTGAAPATNNRVCGALSLTRLAWNPLIATHNFPGNFFDVQGSGDKATPQRYENRARRNRRASKEAH
jgi:hypothetical protein